MHARLQVSLVNLLQRGVQDQGDWRWYVAMNMFAREDTYLQHYYTAVLAISELTNGTHLLFVHTSNGWTEP